MCTKFSEVTLAVHFRETNPDGDLAGGPMYYIKNGLGKKWMWLAYLFSIFGILTVFGTGNATQVNTITTAVRSALTGYGILPDSAVGTFNLAMGILLASSVALVLLGGIKRIGSVAEKLVPFMALLYILLSFGVVFFHLENVPGVFSSIIQGAFSPSAVTGGWWKLLYQYEARRFQRHLLNEAGLGTGSIAHACADTDNPVHQGMFGIFEVFADTIVICTLTALVILCSGIPITYGQDAGQSLRSWALPLPTETGCPFYRDRHVLLCLLHHFRLGALRRKMCGISPFRSLYKALYGNLRSGIHSRSYYGSGAFVEHCRYL